MISSHGEGIGAFYLQMLRICPTDSLILGDAPIVRRCRNTRAPCRGTAMPCPPAALRASLFAAKYPSVLQ